MYRRRLRSISDLRYDMSVAGPANQILRGLGRLGVVSTTAPSAEELAFSALGNRASELPDSVVASLREYLADVKDAGSPNALNYFMLRRMLTDLLRERHALDQAFARCPDIGEVKIDRPVFILGFPRTGTTFLHYLFDSDGATRSPHSWELLSSSDLNDDGDGNRAARITQARRYESSLKLVFPRALLMHPMEASMPQECGMALWLDMWGHFLTGPVHAPSFDVRSREPQRVRSAYRVHRRVLQFLGWNEYPARWVLKDPYHLDHLDHLLNEYPDATIIWTHRNPTQSISSSARLIAEFRRPVYNRHDDRSVGGPILEERVRAAKIGMRVARNFDHEYPSATLINMSYSSLATDPIGTMRGLYEQLQWAWTAETKQTIEERIASNPRPPSRLRRYSADDVGLSDQAIETALGEYMSEYANYLC